MKTKGVSTRAAVLRCRNCKPHSYQDAKYGDHMRVHNGCKDGESQGYRCTVCGNVQRVAVDKAKPADKD
jgi:hypothetical protein